MAASILLVEDDEQSMELAAFLLEEAGLVVHQARSAPEARSEVERARPDLILMDMDLAGLEGLPLVAELRAMRPGQLRIVALTAHAMRGDRERFLAGGCDAYISKPISPRTFVGEVRRYLAGEPGDGA